jgi:flavodoxin
MKTLIVYFSAERGTTARAAREAAESLGAELFAITPEKPYTPGDLNWKNPLARCNREFFGKKEVPTIGKIEDFADYDAVLIGFPIWYGCAPLAVSSFCKGCDWTGKKIAAFATSGGSGIGKTAEKLAPFLPGGELLGAKLIHSGAEVTAWAKELGL